MNKEWIYHGRGWVQDITSWERDLKNNPTQTSNLKFNMAPHGKELSEDLKKRIVALQKDGIGYKKITKTLKLSCSMVAKTIQRFNRTGSTQNRPRHGWSKKLSARAQRHIQRLCLGNTCMSAHSTAAEVEGVGVSLSVLRPYAAHCIKSQKEDSSKDDAEESPQTVCWRQAD